jgi:capsular polysaccharide biosynthesis protein
LLGREQALVDQLQLLGFQVVALEDYTMGEKAWLLARAEAVVGASGAGLSNVVFCSPGCKVIELKTRTVPTPETWDIANRLDLEFFEVLPDKTEDAADPDAGISLESVMNTLDLAGLVRGTRRQMA